MRRKVVGVMGSGSSAHPELSVEVGRAVARLGCHLLTGGGGGVMSAVARAFCETAPREGLSIGILTGRTTASSAAGRELLTHSSAGPNPWVEIPIRTHLPLSGSQGRETQSRNHINVLSSDALVALPGGAGTYSEVTLRIDYGGKVILFLGDYAIDGCVAEHFVSLASYHDQVSVARSSAELDTLIEQALAGGEDLSAIQCADFVASDDLLDAEYVIPELRGMRVLVVGVGGGCDIISAHAFAQVLRDHEPASIVCANTKPRGDERLECISPHVLKVPQERAVLVPGTRTHGTTLIDQSVPRGDGGCPFILLLPQGEEHADALVKEIQSLGFDMVFSIDTGADSIVAEATSGPDGRDRRMLRLLSRLHLPWFHVAISPGCDGETTFDQIVTAVSTLSRSGAYKGRLPVAPMVSTMRELGVPLKDTRTPNIIAAVCRPNVVGVAGEEAVTIPRGIRPKIPRRWLCSALVFDLCEWYQDGGA